MLNELINRYLIEKDSTTKKQRHCILIAAQREYLDTTRSVIPKNQSKHHELILNRAEVCLNLSIETMLLGRYYHILRELHGSDFKTEEQV
ncbi:hypothetical protein J4438_01680 [Candidatus Woesearchaeota archaeon]|nr:hypothetical protein [Candidatus Woesearchaeota archaeon]